ncbi:MAG: LuxR family transcriptional regulator [Nitriliruptoraceae bacterium]
MTPTQVHAPRRTPAEPSRPLDLEAVADELLREAEALASRRSARTLTPGAGVALKQTLLALKAGERLQDHVAPGPTTLLGVSGTAVLSDDEQRVTLTKGVWIPCPTGPHSLEAVSDAVVLITVVPDPQPAAAA